MIAVNDQEIEHLEESSALCFARGLFFGAEAKYLRDREALSAAVSAYYAAFHLGLSMLSAAWSDTTLRAKHPTLFDKLLDDWRKKGARIASGYYSDPVEVVKHGDVPKFLKSEIQNLSMVLGQPGKQASLRDMREFVSYAPRMVRQGATTILYSGCAYSSGDFNCS